MDDAAAGVGQTNKSISASSASVVLAKPHLAAAAEVEQQMLAMLGGDRSAPL